MKKQVKALILGIVIAIAVVFAFTAWASLTGSGGVGGPAVPYALCLIDNDTWVFCDSTHTFGDASEPISSINVNDLTVNDLLTLGGVVGPGGIDLNGNPLIWDVDGDTQSKSYTDDIISFDIGGVGTGEYLFSGTELNLNDNNLTTTGTGTFGLTHDAIIGDDGNNRAGYFTDGLWEVTLIDSDNTIGASFDDGGTFHIDLMSANGAGYFTDGSNTVALADGFSAIQLGDGNTITWGTANGVIEAGATSDTITFKTGATNLALTLDGQNDTANFDDWDITTTGTITGGASTFGDGGTTNYASFASDGLLSLVGTARVKRLVNLPISSATQGASAPSKMVVGNVPVFVFTSNPPEQSAFFAGSIPHDWSDGTDFTLQIYWAPTTAGAGDVVWKIEYSIIRPENNELLTKATTTTTVTDSTQSLQDELLSTSEVTIAVNGSERHDLVSIKISRDVNNAADTYGSSVYLAELHLDIIIDKLGEAL